MPKMQRFKRAVAVTGTYQDNDGNEKKRYTPVGTLFQYDDGGFALKLDAVPIGGEGWISFYDFDDKRDSGGQSQPQQKRSIGGGGSYGAASRGGGVDLNDDIPF